MCSASGKELQVFAEMRSLDPETVARAIAACAFERIEMGTGKRRVLSVLEGLSASIAVSLALTKLLHIGFIELADVHTRNLSDSDDC